MSYPINVAPFTFNIGDEYRTRGKHPQTWTITDRLTTVNNHGDVVKRCYVARREANGQWLTDYDVPQATVAMGRGLLG